MTYELSMHAGGASSASAFLSETEGLQGLLLPTVGVGEKVFVPNKGNDPKDLDTLPDGSKARPGIYLAKRTGVLAWKVGYDNKGEEESPAYIAFAPDSAIDDVSLIGKAVKSRQMMKKVDAHKYDFAESKVGHVKPILELLVWLPDTGFVVITTSPNYHDVVDGVLALKKLIDPATGEIGLVPAMFAPVQKEHKSATWTWNASFCDTMPIVDEKVKATMVEKFAEYRALTAESLDVKAAVDSWLSCSDRPVTEDIRTALRGAVALNSPKH